MNKIFIKYLTILIFISSCGYNPIFSNKNSNFSIKEVRSTGNKKLNIIINNNIIILIQLTNSFIINIHIHLIISFYIIHL